LKPGDVVALIGPLGSGKTTLVQGVAEGWGYKTGATSPTFALMNEYRSRRGLLLHLDMYRLSTAELESFPLEDYLDPSAVCLVEWADRVAGRLPDEALDIHLKIRSPNARLLNISACSSDWRKRLKPLLPAAM
jgi:tRNA threonylcarbamoyladenosine biosynthesis protein TsaE